MEFHERKADAVAKVGTTLNDCSMKKCMTFVLQVAVFGLLFHACTPSEENPNGNDQGTSSAKFNASLTYGSMKDQDGNTYKTITIGTLTWTAENLRTTKYNDSTAIVKNSDFSTWTTLSTGAYQSIHQTTDKDSIATYGLLYNWYAVHTGKLAPAGWHVAKWSDWDKLITAIGGKTLGGGKLKEVECLHWLTPNTAATNETGFTALPAGYSNQGFEAFGSGAYFWTLDNFGSQVAYSYYLYKNTAELISSASYKYAGLSVRLVKD